MLRGRGCHYVLQALHGVVPHASVIRKAWLNRLGLKAWGLDFGPQGLGFRGLGRGSVLYVTPGVSEKKRHKYRLQTLGPLA